MKISDYCWLNGRIQPTDDASPSIASNTLHLGVSVFDGVMAYWNDGHWYLHRLDEHLHRLDGGSRRMGLDTPWTPADLGAGVAELVDLLPHETHYLRPIAYRTGADLFFDVDTDTSSVCVFATPVQRDYDHAYSCNVSPIQRVHHRAIPATWKVSGAYANSYRAEQEARAAGYDTGLMLDIHGRIAETSTSNVLFVDGDAVVSPLLDGDVFPGITREMIKALATERSIPFVERDVWPAELATLDAAMLCGTLAELHPIDRIDGRSLASSRHPIVRRLIDDFRAITHQ
jgi:branched-chain amino acid aminotransferase